MPTGEMDGVTFQHLPGYAHNTLCLEEAGVREADAIIIGPADDLSDKEARACSSHSQLLSVECACTRPGSDWQTGLTCTQGAKPMWGAGRCPAGVHADVAARHSAGRLEPEQQPQRQRQRHSEQLAGCGEEGAHPRRGGRALPSICGGAVLRQSSGRCASAECCCACQCWANACCHADA